MRNPTSWLLLAALLAGAPLAHAQVRSSANFAITVDQLNSGGGNATSAGYVLRGTIGQPFATMPMASTNYAINAGFQASSPNPYLTISPLSLSFGIQAVGSSSASQGVMLTNSGNVAISLSSIGLGGTSPGDFGQGGCGGSIAVSANCVVSVLFTPTALGARSAALQVASSSPNSPQSVALSGTGTNPPVASLSTGTLAFGPRPLNQTSAAQTVTLTNTGSANLSIFSIGVGGAHPGDFAPNVFIAVVTVIPPSGVHTIDMTFTPSGLGTRTASLSFTTDAAGSPHMVALSGTGTPGMVRFDLDGDGKSDIVWRNAGSGDNYLFPMSGLSIGAGQGYLRNVPGPWTIAGIGDFDGDGKADLLWRNTVTGDTYLFLMNGMSVVGEGYGRNVPTDWAVAGVGDLNGDGKADLVWRNATSGDNYVYFMNGLAIGTEGYLPNVPSPWTIATIGDFDGDGRSDLYWRNTSTGDTYFFLMNGLAIANQGYGRNVPTSWALIGAGDYNGDGKADLLWRNATSGDNYLFLQNGIGLAGEGYLRNVPAPWTIVGTGDYDGDGRADILWRNTATGDDYLFLMNGLNVTGEGYLPSVPTNWAVVK